MDLPSAVELLSIVEYGCEVVGVQGVVGLTSLPVLGSHLIGSGLGFGIGRPGYQFWKVTGSPFDQRDHGSFPSKKLNHVKFASLVSLRSLVLLDNWTHGGVPLNHWDFRC